MTVVSSGLYGILDIPRTASHSDVGRAYRRKAKEVHPDKNLDDPNAVLKFQEITKAYQILSNPDFRAHYDETGNEDLMRHSLLNPGEVVMSVFGADVFGSFVGQLRLATITSLAFSNDKVNSLLLLKDSRVGGGRNMWMEKAERLIYDLSVEQRKRVESLVTFMTSKVDIFADGDILAFDDWAYDEIQTLENAKFGSEMLRTIGFIYQRVAMQRLLKNRGSGIRLGLGCAVEWVTLKAHMVHSGFSAVCAAFQIIQVHSQLQSMKENGGNIDEVCLKQHMETIVEQLWKLNVVDIEQTLEIVCEKVLMQPGVTDELLNELAQALKVLGIMFQARADKLKLEEERIRSRKHDEETNGNQSKPTDQQPLDGQRGTS